MPTQTFTGNFKNLEQIGNFVGRAAEEAGFDDTGIYAIQLAVDEACTNIIEHAYGGEEKGNIDISIEKTRVGLRIMLHDCGKPFDPDTVPMPQTNLPLEEIQPRGVGLYLMKRMMDEIHFDFTPDRGNILTMVKCK